MTSGLPSVLSGVQLVEHYFETHAKSEGSGTFCDNIGDADAMHAISTRSRFQRLALDWCHAKYNRAEK